MIIRHRPKKPWQPGKERVRAVTIQTCMPALDPTIMIVSEPDIMRPAALYLLHPVHMALTALHPNVAIHCLAEAREDKKTRPDIVYKKDGRVFALLEYKVPKAIVTEDFEKARMGMQSSLGEIDARKETAQLGGYDTLFGPKATILMKQVSKYVENVHTDYAALFNWDFLFLSVYDKRDSELIYGSLISREGSEGNELRKAYLGWLLEAFNNDGKSHLDPPGGRHQPGEGTRKSARLLGAGGAGQGSGTLGEGHPPASRSSGSGSTAGHPGSQGGASGQHGSTASAHSNHPSSASSQVAKTAPPTATLPLRHAQGPPGAQDGRHGQASAQVRQPLAPSQATDLKQTRPQAQQQPPQQAHRQDPVLKQIPQPRRAQSPQRLQPAKQGQQGATVMSTTKSSQPKNVKKSVVVGKN